MNRLIQAFILTATILLLHSCSSTKYLPEGETLYTGSTVQIKDDNASKREKKVLKKDLQGAILPKPNSTFLGFRFKLYMYNLAGEPKKDKGFKHWLRTKFGEPPVLGSELDLDKNKKLLTNILENRGFFYPNIEAERKVMGKKTSGSFDVYTGQQYKIRNVYFPTDTTQLSKDIRAQENETLLKKDVPYNLDLIKGERDRIDRRLKEIGYYYFKSDYIIAMTDSSVGDHKVDILIKAKDDVPVDAAQVYRIGNVYIYPRYNLLNRARRLDNADTSVSLARAMNSRRRRRMGNDSLFYERYFIMGNTRAYKPQVFTQAMQFAPGDLYNRTDHNMALNRLINMGTFKFVRNEFVPTSPGVLNTYYYLTPHPKKTLQAELGAYTKNDGRVGSQVSVSWRNRNTLRGAELLTIRATGGFETQSGGGVKRPNIYQLGFEPRLSVPRFVVPFFDFKPSSFFVPRTTLYVGYDLLTRMNLYLIHSFRAGYGYEWKEDIKRDHQLYPINITRVITDTLAPDTATARYNYSNLIFNGLIFGPTYNFTYNSRGDGPPNRNDFYFNGLADLSGNIVGLVQGADTPGSKTLFGTPYAQYVKLQTDFRYYMNYGANPNSIWANRIIIGLGMPYGNSSRLPNIKQFFSGGNSSLRGFPSRLVGPGEFVDTLNRFLETSGDLKLELNTEVRAQLYDFVHGAVFLDAGNVWLARPDSVLFPGGEFKADKFLSQLAVNVGVGIRFDFQIFLIRLDVATPIKRAWEAADNSKAISDAMDRKTTITNNNWFKQNVVFNLGIGYPF